MASAGPNNGGTFASLTLAGSTGTGWTNPGNAGASDDVYATSVFSSGGSGYNDYLKATNFGFTVPGGATINGITVEIERKVGSGSFGVKDKSVRIVKGGTVTGTDLASATAWPTADAYATYGGSASLWGATWLDTDINASTFGVVVAFQSNATGKSSVAASIDHIRITVTYTAGGASFIAKSNKPISQAVKRASSY